MSLLFIFHFINKIVKYENLKPDRSRLHFNIQRLAYLMLSHKVDICFDKNGGSMIFPDRSDSRGSLMVLFWSEVPKNS